MGIFDNIETDGQMHSYAEKLKEAQESEVVQRQKPIFLSQEFYIVDGVVEQDVDLHNVYRIGEEDGIPVSVNPKLTIEGCMVSKDYNGYKKKWKVTIEQDVDEM